MKTFKIVLATTYSGYDRFTASKEIFVKEFETKREAMKFFRAYAKENNFMNTAYSDTKLGFHEGKQVELTTTF